LIHITDARRGGYSVRIGAFYAKSDELGVF